MLILPITLLSSGICIAAEASLPKWTYDNDYTGQEDWGSIKGYETCRHGTNQSPVIISFTKTTPLPPLNFKYTHASGILHISNQYFVMEVTNGKELIDNGNSYSLQSIEIHSPAGHKIKDSFYPVEINLIHKDKNGDLLIVAVFVNLGGKNPAIETMLKQAATGKAEKTTIDSTQLISDAKSYYSYKGSLPYPPCTENVKWIILKKPITISPEQLSAIGKHVGRNARLPQPLYMREVLETQP